jgi:uncharacterized protein YbjT (DUF2867 family)
VATNLLAGGQKVRVVGRNAAHLQPLAAKGAEAFVADVTDAVALAKAFDQAESAYVMIPPNPASTDPLGYSNRVSDAIAAAVQNAGTKNVVALSSIGTDKDSGTGPVLGLHNLEQKLNQIIGANVLHLRAVYFMENTLPQVNAIRMMGSAAGPLRPDLKLPMIATRDIGNAAAEALLRPIVRGKQTRELLGPRISPIPKLQRSLAGPSASRTSNTSTRPTISFGVSWCKWECPTHLPGCFWK